MDEPVLQGPLRGVLGALEEHLQQRVGDAHEADGAGDAAARGQQAEGHLGQADLGAGGVEGDAVVGGEGDLVAAAEGRAVDGGDDRLAQGLDATQEDLMAVPVSKASWAFSGPALIMSLRSPPAKKVFLAEV